MLFTIHVQTSSWVKPAAPLADSHSEAPCGFPTRLGPTHLYGIHDGQLVIYSNTPNTTLWALDHEGSPVARICRQQPPTAKLSRSDRDGTFWIDLRCSLTRTIALGCEWLEPIDRDDDSGLFLAQINHLMAHVPRKTTHQN